MGKIDSNTIIVEEFNTPLTSIERSLRQKINKETITLNDTLDQLDLIDIYRAFHPKKEENTFFKCTCHFLQARSHASPQSTFKNIRG